MWYGGDVVVTFTRKVYTHQQVFDMITEEENELHVHCNKLLSASLLKRESRST